MKSNFSVKIQRQILQAITWAALGLGFLNCSNVNLLRAPAQVVTAASLGEFCTEAPLVSGSYSNIMFVLDMSGSNAGGNAGGPPTDPQKALRGNAVQSYLNAHRNNSFIHWGFVVFNNGNATSYIPDQGGPTPNNFFTGDPTLMDAALAKFRATADMGNTPYKAAMSIVQSAIIADQKKFPNISADYEVVWLSDGYPTDYGTPIDTAALNTDDSNLVNLALGMIHLSTVYYGPPDPVAEGILSNMAKLGFGKYQNTNLNPNINIDNLLSAGTFSEPYLIKQLAVYNLNAALCDDGTVGADSDGDGLCDKDEEHYNHLADAGIEPYATKMAGIRFSITNRNSFDPHFSDSYYLKFIQGQSLPSGCDDISDEDHDLANACEEKFMSNTAPQGPTFEWTSQMINMPHIGDTKNFDSDGDGIIDGLEMLFFKNQSAALNYNNILNKTNGYDNLYLFLNHLNPIDPGSSLPYNPKITQIQKNEKGQNCYSYHQENLPLYSVKPVDSSEVSGNLSLVHAGDENIILVYYIQTPENAPNSKGVLRFSYQKLKVGRDGADAIRLTPAIFDVYPK